MSGVFIICGLYHADPGFWRAQVASLRAQSDPGWRCLMLDDGGNEPLAAEIAALVRDDPRFSYHRNLTRQGVYRNFETGLRAVPEDCDLICFCDQDDVWEPGKLARLRTEFRDPTVLLAHSDLTLIDGQDRVLAPSAFAYEGRHQGPPSAARLVVRNSVTGCALMLRRSLLDHALPFPEMGPRRIVLHDSWCAILAALMGRVAVVPEPLIRYRQHGGNVVGAVAQTGSGGLRAALGWVRDYARLIESIRHLVLVFATRPEADPRLTRQARRCLGRLAMLRLGARLLLGGDRHGWPTLVVGLRPLWRRPRTALERLGRRARRRCAPGAASGEDRA